VKGTGAAGEHKDRRNGQLNGTRNISNLKKLLHGSVFINPVN
jgi:hypothetical protein